MITTQPVPVADFTAQLATLGTTISSIRENVSLIRESVVRLGGCGNMFDNSVSSVEGDTCGKSEQKSTLQNLKSYNLDIEELNNDLNRIVTHLKSLI